MNENNSSKTLLWVVLAAVVLFLLLWAFDIIDFSAQGDVEAPDVDVSVDGGELPDVDADVADVDVGTEEVTVEVPEVDVEGATPDEE